jgi:hypothetical protein
MEKYEQIGFDIGWDFASFGVYPEETKYKGTVVEHGYKAYIEKNRGKRPKDADRFIRKWLYLRGNAWRRSRIFHPEVTPEFLKKIDSKYCPITRIELTHGTKQDTDWSVDRINNDGGYTCDNIIIMSTRANKAKDRLTLDRIRETIHKNPNGLEQGVCEMVESLDGLNEQEMRRLLTLLYIHIQEKRNIGITPVIHPIPGMLVGSFYVMCWHIARMAFFGTVSSTHDAKLKSLDPNDMKYKSFTSALKAAIKEEVANAPKDLRDMNDFELQWILEDTWANHPEVFKKMAAWYNSKPVPMKDLLFERCVHFEKFLYSNVDDDVIRRRLAEKHDVHEIRAKWGEDSKGFMVLEPEEA